VGFRAKGIGIVPLLYVNIAFFDGDLSENYKKNKLTFCTCNSSLVLSVPVGAYEVSLKAFAHNTVARIRDVEKDEPPLERRMD